MAEEVPILRRSYPCVSLGPAVDIITEHGFDQAVSELSLAREMEEPGTHSHVWSERWCEATVIIDVVDTRGDEVLVPRDLTPLLGLVERTIEAPLPEQQGDDGLGADGAQTALIDPEQIQPEPMTDPVLHGVEPALLQAVVKAAVDFHSKGWNGGSGVAHHEVQVGSRGKVELSSSQPGAIQVENITKPDRCPHLETFGCRTCLQLSTDGTLDGVLYRLQSVHVSVLPHTMARSSVHHRRSAHRKTRNRLRVLATGSAEVHAYAFVAVNSVESLLTDGFTWDTLRQLMSRPESKPGWRKAGLWCIDVCSDVLGETWATSIWRRGELPDWIVLSATYRQAMLELLEFSMRLHLLEEFPGAGSLRRDLRRDLERSRIVHSKLQLEVAALTAAAGAIVTLESVQPGGYSADVTFAFEDSPVLVECQAILIPEPDRQASERTDQLTDTLTRMSLEHSVEIFGEFVASTVGSDDLEAFELLLTAVGWDRSEPVGLQAWWGWLRAQPADQGALASVRFAGPETDLGRHLLGKVIGKAPQVAQSGGVWLRVDVLSGLWQFTPWSARGLDDKIEQLVRHIEPLLTGQTNLSGVVLSSGACQFNGEFEEQVVHGEASSLGLRTALPVGRCRETIIIPLSDSTEGDVARWGDLYLRREPQWLPEALQNHGLPTLHEMFE